MKIGPVYLEWPSIVRVGETEITVPFLIKWFWPVGVGVAFVVCFFLFTGPRMTSQANIRPFRASMPLPPEGSVPAEPVVTPLPSPQEAATMTNPLKPSVENISRGRTFYGYYCAFCHGQRGDGVGPVGPHYVPAPADLASPAIQAMPDGKLLLASLTGVGHSPVLSYAVPAEFRWYLVLYVRQFKNRPPGPIPANPG